MLEFQNQNKPRHEISNNVVCATNKASDQPVHTRNLIRAFASRLNILMTVKLLTEHHLEFLSLKGGCTGSSGSTLVKMPHCWKSHVAALVLLALEIVLSQLKVYILMKCCVLGLRCLQNTLGVSRMQRVKEYK